MRYVYANPNPLRKTTNDCVMRAVSILLNQSWDQTYKDLSDVGFEICEPTTSDATWWTYLKRLGYTRTFIPNTCPDCYSVKRFCEDHPYGRHLIKASGHVVTVVDSNYYDTWDSGDEIPIYYVSKGA